MRKPSPPPSLAPYHPPQKKEEIKKIVPAPLPPPKAPAAKKKVEEEDDDEYFDEEAEKEKDRLRKLRNMNRRAHRGFSQAEIMMMRWEMVPPKAQMSSDDWECKICKKPIINVPPSKYLELKCSHKYHK